MTLTFDLLPWKSIGFQTLLRTKYVPSLVKIHWRILILECSQGCYVVKILPLDLWTWKSIRFQILIRTMYVPSLVKIHWRMLILECSQGCYAVKIWSGDLDLWPWKINGKLTSDALTFLVELISDVCCKSVLSKITGYRSMLMDILFMFPGNYCIGNGNTINITTNLFLFH